MNQVVLGLIVVNVLFSYKGINDRFFLDKYKFQIGPILNGEKIRMLTSGFLHADYMHLGFNMYALYVFSGGILYSMGVSNFLIIYMGSLLAGSLFTLMYHKKDLYYSAVGASGAVSGVVYCAILLDPNMSLMMLPIPIPIPGYIFGIGYLLYSIYGMKKQLGNIGHSAHLGGAIGGFVLTLLLQPEVLMDNMLMVAILALPIILLLVFEKRLKK